MKLERAKKINAFILGIIMVIVGVYIPALTPRAEEVDLFDLGTVYIYITENGVGLCEDTQGSKSEIVESVNGKTLADLGVSYDETTKTVTFENFQVKSRLNYSMCSVMRDDYADESIKIVMKGENIIDTNGYFLQSYSNVDMSGDGSLSLKGGQGFWIYHHDLTISGITINAIGCIKVFEACGNNDSYGNEDVTLSKCTLNTTSDVNCIAENVNEFKVDHSTINAKSSQHSFIVKSFSMKDSTVNAESSTNVITAVDGITIDNCQADIKCTGYGCALLSEYGKLTIKNKSVVDVNSSDFIALYADTLEVDNSTLKSETNNNAICSIELTNARATNTVKNNSEIKLNGNGIESWGSIVVDHSKITIDTAATAINTYADLRTAQSTINFTVHGGKGIEAVNTEFDGCKTNIKLSGGGYGIMSTAVSFKNGTTYITSEGDGVGVSCNKLTVGRGVIVISIPTGNAMYAMTVECDKNIISIVGGSSSSNTEPVENYMFPECKYIKISTKPGWVKSDGKWYYYDNNALVTGWKKISNKWYYFNSDGIMMTGWQKINNVWYYFDGGAMVTGWKKISNKWYYFALGGAMQTGWQKISNVWYYFDGGAMVTGWKKISNKWYYFAPGGAMQTGWQKISNVWYYFDGGVMVTGWKQINNKWYYFMNGAMVTGTQKIDGKTYRFDSNGVWIK